MSRLADRCLASFILHSARSFCSEGESPWTKPWLSDGHPAGFQLWVRLTLVVGFVLPSIALGASYLVGAANWGLALLLPYLLVLALQTGG